MRVATHSHKRKPGTTVRLIVWSHERGIEGSNLNVGVYQGDVYYQTVEGEKTPQERDYGVQMLGHLSASSVLETFEPLEGQEDYHKTLIETVERINGK